MLFLRQAVLQGQAGAGCDEADSAEGNQPEVEEDDSQAKKANGASHSQRPDGAWGEEAKDASGIFSFCLFPILWQDVTAVIGEVKVSTQHHAQQKGEEHAHDANPLGTLEVAVVLNEGDAEDVDNQRDKKVRRD